MKLENQPWPTMEGHQANEHPIRVLCVDDDRHHCSLIHDTVGDRDDFEVVTATGIDEALAVLDEVECVVSADSVRDGTGIELFETIRSDGYSLPCILFSSDESRQTIDSVLDMERTGYISWNGTLRSYRSLQNRIKQLVNLDRERSLARRMRAAVEAVPDGVAIVEPDETFQYVDKRFARELGYDRQELLEQCWQDCYTDDTVDHFESTIRPTVSDSWRWSGQCTALRKDGQTVSTQTCVVGLEDGSFVFLQTVTKG